MSTQRPEIPRDDFDKPLGSDLPERQPLDLLPDREWLRAEIASVRYQYSMFNNKVQYYTNQDGEEILDEEGKRIPRREFEITFELKDFDLPNGKPRNAWLRMSASKGDKAHLPVFLFNMGIQDAYTPQDVIDRLTGANVLIQVANKPNMDNTKVYQNVIYGADKPASAAREQMQGPEPITDDDFDIGEPDPEEII